MPNLHDEYHEWEISWEVWVLLAFPFVGLLALVISIIAGG